MVAGHGVVYGLAAMIGIGVGALVRQTAGAISFLLVWMLLVENLVQLLPNVGDDIARWLPFNNAALFAGDQEMVGVMDPLGSPTASLAVFAATGLLIMIAATVVVRRRDA